MIKANQIDDAILILSESIKKAQSVDDTRTARAIETMRDIQRCCELQAFFNSFAGAQQVDCQYNESRDEFYAAATRYLNTRLADPNYARQLRFAVEQQTAL